MLLHQREELPANGGEAPGLELDEQIVAVRNQIHGVNLGAELQKQIDAEAEAAKETPPEE